MHYYSNVDNLYDNIMSQNIRTMLAVCVRNISKLANIRVRTRVHLLLAVCLTRATSKWTLQKYVFKLKHEARKRAGAQPNLHFIKSRLKLEKSFTQHSAPHNPDTLPFRLWIKRSRRFKAWIKYVISYIIALPLSVCTEKLVMKT